MGDNNMQIFVLGLLIILAMAPHSYGSYCVCKTGLQTAAYQKAIDFACGAGADCSAIRPNGQCYNPNSLQAHCSFAANNYFQKNSAKGATCDFQGAAVLTNSDPSGGGCSFSSGSGSTSTGTGTPTTTVPTTSPTTPTTTPAFGGGGGGGTMPVTPVSGTGTPTSGTGTPTSGTGTGTSTNPTTTSPNTPSVGNPTSTGVLGGGMGTGLAPTGSSMDDNHSTKLDTIRFWSTLVTLVMSGVMYII
ncbi:hypothetical protein RND81_10G214000 [Saponaria officinalis]|uniref:X8 domain-containing protein n=1 Tax=Saponaria officinalis TaxID=3572 RepID=A0AAW1I4R9_SAPOF